MKETPAALPDAPTAPPAAAADLRRIADFMRLWRLCDAARCRRARACRGAPRECLTRLSPLVPEKAREFIVGLFVAKECGRPFEDVEWRFRAEQEAFDAWIAALDGTMGRPVVRREETRPCENASFRGAPQARARNSYPQRKPS